MKRILGGIILVGIFSSCAVRPNIPLGIVPPPIKPADNEFVVTRGYIEQQFNQGGNKLIQKGPGYLRVKRIVDRLSVAAGAQGFTYPVYIADAGDDKNAMAVRDTTIVVLTGLLKSVPNDDELATVLAHEVAHILARHNADNTSNERQGWIGVASSVLGSAASYGADRAGVPLSDTIGSATETATNVVGTATVVRSYDRKLEYEADQIGVILMAKAGYDPEAAIRFWNKATELFGGDTGGVFLSTHPTSGNRTERLKEAMPLALQYYQKAKASGPTGYADDPKPVKKKKK